MLRVEEATVHPRSGEVLLRVEAFGLNRADSMFMRGHFFEETRLPAHLGYEASGTVKEVGTGVDIDWMRKRVSIIPAFSPNEYGMAGDEVIVPVHALAEYPARLSAVEAAAIWVQYLTAYGAIVEIGRIQRGEFVLITAASSSAGVAAIETVRAERGKSIAITRTASKREELTALGADHVVVLEEEDMKARVEQVTGGKGVRIIVDSVAGPLLETLANIAVPGGIIIEYGALSEHPAPFPQIAVLSKRLTIRGYWMAETLADPIRRKKAQKYVIDRINDGRFRPRISKVFPFAQIAEAYRS